VGQLIYVSGTDDGTARETTAMVNAPIAIAGGLALLAAWFGTKKPLKLTAGERTIAAIAGAIAVVRSVKTV